MANENVTPHAIPFVDRPAHRENKIEIPFTADQREAQKVFAATLQSLLTPTQLKAMGAFWTPGDEKTTKDGKSYTPIMLALSIPMPAIEFDALSPDDSVDHVSTRPWVFALNVGIGKQDGSKGTTAGTLPAPKAASFKDFLKTIR